MDVQVLPTLSNFPSTPDIPTREVESHPRDESWETVDSEKADIPKTLTTISCEIGITQSMKEVIPCCSNYAEGNGREVGTVTMFEPKHQYGFITPDFYIPGRDPDSLSLYFHRIYDDPDIKKATNYLIITILIPIYLI